MYTQHPASHSGAKFFRGLPQRAFSFAAGLTALLLLLSVAGRAQTVVRTRVTGAANWGTASMWIKTLTGTITFNSGRNVVNGSRAAFTSPVQAGDVVMLASAPGTAYVVSALQTATQLTIGPTLDKSAGVDYSKEELKLSYLNQTLKTEPLAKGVIRLGN